MLNNRFGAIFLVFLFIKTRQSHKTYQIIARANSLYVQDLYELDQYQDFSIWGWFRIN